MILSTNEFSALMLSKVNSIDRIACNIFYLIKENVNFLLNDKVFSSLAKLFQTRLL